MVRKLLILTSFSLFSITSLHLTPFKENDVSKYLTLNASNVYTACKLHGIKYPEIVVSQSILETGNYTSRICKQYNNLFGLYDSKNKRYFKFDNWINSVIAYKNSVQYRLKDNETDYYKFLRRIKYASDPNYVLKIEKIKNNHFNNNLKS